VIQKYIEDPIAEEMLKGKFSDGSMIKVLHEGNNLTFIETARKTVVKSEARKPASPPPPEPESVEN
jgi:hypothetical protein